MGTTELHSHFVIVHEFTSLVNGDYWIALTFCNNACLCKREREKRRGKGGKDQRSSSPIIPLRNNWKIRGVTEWWTISKSKIPSKITVVYCTSCFWRGMRQSATERMFRVGTIYTNKAKKKNPACKKSSLTTSPFWVPKLQPTRQLVKLL